MKVNDPSGSNPSLEWEPDQDEPSPKKRPFFGASYKPVKFVFPQKRPFGQAKYKPSYAKSACIVFGKYKICPNK